MFFSDSFSFALCLFLLKLVHSASSPLLSHGHNTQMAPNFMQILMSSFCFCFSFPDNCRNRPQRPPRKPLRPVRASKQLPPEPTQMTSDEVKRLSPPQAHMNPVLKACVVLRLPQTLPCLGKFRNFPVCPSECGQRTQSPFHNMLSVVVFVGRLHQSRRQ